jgi:hypothetical protein
MPDELTEHARATTFRVCRVMYPHDQIPDEAYEAVVAAIEAEARGSDAVQQMIEEGVADLDVPTPFTELDPDAQLEALRAKEGTDYFNLVRATSVVALYDNPKVWEILGYEGPSVHLGGYINRGFNDLDWLPDPPIELDPTAGSHHR